MQTFAMHGYFSLQLLGPGTGILLSHLDVLCSRTFLDPRGGVDLFPIVQWAHSQAPSTQHTHTHTWSSQPPGKQNFCSQFKGEETSLGDPVSRLRQLSQLGAELEYKPECSDFNSCSSSFFRMCYRLRALFSSSRLLHSAHPLSSCDQKRENRMTERKTSPVPLMAHLESRSLQSRLLVLL